MKTWFPLTNYDFYAYLSSGIILIASVDYVFTDAVLVNRAEWTVVQAAFWTVIAYLSGQLVAAPSSLLIEHLIARKLFRPPASVILGLTQPRLRERVIASLFANREYRPFAGAIRESIISKASSAVSASSAHPIDAEMVFEIAFPLARTNSDTVNRLDTFINNYGFARNLCLVFTLAFLLLTYQYFTKSTQYTAWLALGAFIMAIGMYGRFIKFYASYSREVFRTYNSLSNQLPAASERRT
jgi:hypothetical protein